MDSNWIACVVSDPFGDSNAVQDSSRGVKDLINGIPSCPTWSMI